MSKSILALSFLFALAASGQGPRGNAATGAKLFKDLRCVTCHSVNGMGGNTAPALGGRAYTPNTMAGAMWSHVTGMWQAMDKAGIKRVQLTEQQAADLYTFFAGGVNPDKPGDAKRGAQVYEAKLCSSCHEGIETGASRLTALAGRVTPFFMVSAVLEHGSGMLSRMVSKNVQWQQLSAEEMGHLIAFLNTKR